MIPPPSLSLEGHQFQLWLPESVLKPRIAQMAREIGAQLANSPEPLWVVPLLSGAFRFAAELLPQLQLPYRLAFVRVRTTEGTTVAARVPEPSIFPQPPAGHRVLLLEDVVDTGRSLDAVTDHLAARGLVKVQCATLLFKPGVWKGRHAPTWVGFDAPDAFVVGFGLDVNEQGRHLPGLYTQTPAA